MKNKTAVIRKCKEGDAKGEDNWCLYTHDGSKLLGRHPSKESAEEQEKAIQVSKHSRLGNVLADLTCIGQDNDQIGHTYKSLRRIVAYLECFDARSMKQTHVTAQRIGTTQEQVLQFLEMDSEDINTAVTTAKEDLGSHGYVMNDVVEDLERAAMLISENVAQLRILADAHRSGDESMPLEKEEAFIDPYNTTDYAGREAIIDIDI